MAVFALIAAIPLLLLFGCAHAPADDDCLWKIRNFYQTPKGAQRIGRLGVMDVARPGCVNSGSLIICPPREDGWQFVAEIERGCVIATWQQRRV